MIQFLEFVQHLLRNLSWKKKCWLQLVKAKLVNKNFVFYFFSFLLKSKQNKFCNLNQLGDMFWYIKLKINVFKFH